MLTQMLFMQGYVSPRQKSSLNIYYSCHHELVDSYEISRFYLYCFLYSITDNNFTRLDCRTPEFTPIFISPGQCSPLKPLRQMNRQLVGDIYGRSSKKIAEISDNIIYDPKIEVFFSVCNFRTLRSFVYSDNNQRIGHIKDETPYAKYDVNNANMNTLQRFGFFVTVCIP